MMKHILLMATLMSAAAAPLNAQVVQGCGALQNHYGPYDYRFERARLNIVERAHFTPEVEQLIRGATGSLWHDLDYTLRASPNHHRALMTMIRWERQKVAQRAKFSKREMRADCYLKRAEAFAPNDADVRVLTGLHFFNQKQYPQAKAKFEEAVAIDRTNLQAQYNLGLAHFYLKEYDEAEDIAKKVYRQRFPVSGLKDLLREKGRVISDE